MAHEAQGQFQSDDYIFSQPDVPTPDRRETSTSPVPPTPRRLTPKQQQEARRAATSLPPPRSTGKQK